MLELLFQGLIEWLYGLILETWEYFFSVFMTVLSVDFAYLRLHIPIIPEIMKIMLAAGWALLLGNMVFQAMKSMMTGLGFEGEDPKLLFTRSFVFSFLLFASPQLCQLGLDMAAKIITLLDITNAAEVTLTDVDTFAGLGAAWLLTIIINIVLMFKIISFLLEIVERYLVLAFLTICAPLAFGVGGSKNTADIFTGWCRMFASMCFMMVSSMLCFKLLLALLGNVPVGADIFLWIALVFGVLKLARKVDAIITRIGLNPAITGDGLGGRSLPGILAFTAMRTMVTQAVKTAGGRKGGAGQGSGSKSGTGNGGRGAGNGEHGTGSSGHGAGNGGRGAGKGNGKAGASPNVGAAAAQGRQKQGNRPDLIIPDDIEDAAMNGPAPGNTVSTNAPASGGESAKGTERKSSVPPGTVRSPSVVKQSSSASKSNHTAGKTAATTASSESKTAKAVRGERHTHAKSEAAGGAKTRTGPAKAAGTTPDSPSRLPHSNTAGAPDKPAGMASSAQPRFTGTQRTVQSGAAQAGNRAASSPKGSAKPVSGKVAKSENGKAAEPRYSQKPASPAGVSGSASKASGASAPSAGAGKGATAHSGTAGTVSNVSVHPERSGGADIPNGTAGTASGTQSRFTNVERSNQSSAARQDKHTASTSATGGKVLAQQVNSGAGVPDKDNPAVRETRYSQIPKTAAGASGASPVTSGASAPAPQSGGIPSPAPGTAGTSPNTSLHTERSGGADIHTGTAGTQPAAQARFTNAAHTSQISTTQASKPVSGQSGSTQERVSLQHGTAGTAGSPSAAMSGANAGARHPGPAGTASGTSAQPDRASGTGVRDGTAGNPSEMQARITNAPHTTQHSAVQSSSQVSGHAPVAQGAGQQMKQESTPAHRPTDSGAKDTRFSQRPAASAERLPYGTAGTSEAKTTGADKGGHSLPGTAGITPASMPHPSHTESADARNLAAKTERPAAVKTGTESANIPARMTHIPTGGNAPAASASARQEARPTHTPGATHEEPRRASATAQQESLSPRPVSAESRGAHTAASSVPARQEPHTVVSSSARQEAYAGHPSGGKPAGIGKAAAPPPARQEPRAPRMSGTMGSVPHTAVAPASAQQESRLMTRSGATEKAGSPVPRPGTAGIRPPAAQGASAEKSERAPHQEVTQAEPKPDKDLTAETAGTQGEEKEEDASERTG